MYMNYFSLILLTAFLGLSNMAQAHGPIPMPLEAINNILDKQFPKKTDEIDKDFTDFPSIISDINALNSKERNTHSDAYKRLIARGDEVTPEIILRIYDSETSVVYYIDC